MPISSSPPAIPAGSRRRRWNSARRAPWPSTPPTSTGSRGPFDDLPTPIDHVLVTGPGPYYAPPAEFDVEQARRNVEAHLLLPLQVARNAQSRVRPGGTLLFMGGVEGLRAAALLGDQLVARREQLRTILPIQRVIGPADIAALAVHLMANTAVTGATFDIDGGQQLIAG